MSNICCAHAVFFIFLVVFRKFRNSNNSSSSSDDNTEAYRHRIRTDDTPRQQREREEKKKLNHLIDPKIKIHWNWPQLAMAVAIFISTEPNRQICLTAYPFNWTWSAGFQCDLVNRSVECAKKQQQPQRSHKKSRDRIKWNASRLL